MADEKVIDLNRLSRFHDNLKSNGLPLNNWQASKKYKVNYPVLYENKIYRCIEAHTASSTFDETKWRIVGNKSGTTLYSDTPIGTIISYMGNNPPKDYLSCDGTVYSISDYQSLADFINTEFGSYGFFGGDGTTTFAVPDLRGEFLRGTGTNSHTNQGDGSNVGEHQNATQIPYIFMSRSPDFNGPGYESFPTNTDRTIGSGTNRVYAKSGTYKEYGELAKTMFYTTKPTNTSVLYCIKYTNSNSPEKIDIWTANTSYSVGNIVIYNDKIYRCAVDHTSGTDFSVDRPKYWESLGDNPIINDWISGNNYTVGTCVIKSNQNGIVDWTASKQYNVNDEVVYNGYIYTCKTQNTDTEFTESNWKVKEPVYNRIYRCIKNTNSKDFNESEWQLINGDSKATVDEVDELLA